MKNSPTHPTNISRPAAFLAAKHEIMKAKDATGIKQAQKAIDNYIYQICEKPLRSERQLDLTYILNWKIAQLRDDGIDTPEPINIGVLSNEAHTSQISAR